MPRWSLIFSWANRENRAEPVFGGSAAQGDIAQRPGPVLRVLPRRLSPRVLPLVSFADSQIIAKYF